MSTFKEPRIRKTDPEKLILAVKKHPCIWDSRNPMYRLKGDKQKAWNKVGSEVIESWGSLSRVERHISHVMLLKKWKSLRGCYVREMKRQKRVETGSPVGPRKNEYMHYQLLQFLDRVVAPHGLSDTDEDTTTSEEEENDSPECHNNGRTKKKFDDVADLINTLSKYSKQKKVIKRYGEDEDKLFLLSLLTPLKLVPEDKKMTVKIKMMVMLNEAGNADNSAKPAEKSVWNLENNFGWDLIKNANNKAEISVERNAKIVKAKIAENNILKNAKKNIVKNKKKKVVKNVVRNAENNVVANAENDVVQNAENNIVMNAEHNAKDGKNNVVMTGQEVECNVENIIERDVRVETNVESSIDIQKIIECNVGRVENSVDTNIEGNVCNEKELRQEHIETTSSEESTIQPNDLVPKYMQFTFDNVIIGENYTEDTVILTSKSILM